MTQPEGTRTATADPLEPRWSDLARSQIELLSMAEGFFASSVLFALLKVGVFEELRQDARTALELGPALGADPAHLARLLDAGVALKLLDAEGASYRLRPRWAPLLAECEGEGYLGDWLRFLDYSASALGRLDQAARQGGPTVDLMGIRDPGSIRDFALAMHNFAVLRGREIAEHLDTSGCRSLLDVGCGPGTYAYLLGAANPRLELHLADGAEVLEVAAEVRGRFSLENPVRYLPLDATREAVPGVYDLVLVSNMLHMLGADESRALLKRLFHAVGPGGSLVVQAQYLEDDRRGGRWPVLMDLILLCITAKGHNHSVAETTAWLEEAGFGRIDHCRFSILNPNSYLRAYRA